MPSNRTRTVRRRIKLKSGILCPYCGINKILPSWKCCRDCSGHIRPTGERAFKIKVRSETKRLITKKVLTRQPCEKCGGKSEIHHIGYSDPTKIKWLCKKHHLEEHRLLKKMLVL
jgi:hypothetical protein